MSNRKQYMVTGFRIINIIFLQALLYRNETIDLFFTAVTGTAIAFWLVPWALSELFFKIFKIEEKYGGKLLFDDSDPTDCHFRMIFEVDPEDLAKEPTFMVKCERANLSSRETNTH